MSDSATKPPSISASDWYKKGIELENNGALMQAVASYKALLAMHPAHKQVQKRLHKLAQNMNRMNSHYQQGIQYFQQQQLQKAAQSFEKARSILPQVPEVLSNLAACLYQIGKIDRALLYVTQALSQRPDYTEALNTLGNIELSRGNTIAAKTAYQKAVQTDPKYMLAHYNLANLLKQEKQTGDAITAYQAALAADPKQPSILAELYQQYYTLHRWQEAQAIAETLTQLAGNNQLASASPFPLLLLDNPALQLKNAQLRAKQYWPHAKAYDASCPLPSEKKDRWHIGYLSSDFHNHATAYLMAELFEQHDKTQFKIFAYSAGPDKDCAERRRIVQSADKFSNIGNLNAQDAAEQIRADGIDILVDLKGHTNGQRLDIAAMRPAPIGMHYLGYPGTIGLPAIDYFIADNITIPQGGEEYFNEQLIHLPQCYQINDRQRPLPKGTLSRTDCGLPQTGLIFCNFNQSYKITKEIWAAWMSILKQAEGSVLWLLEYSDEATTNIKAHAAEYGIDPARIIIAPHVPLAEHLERYVLADLVLDTFPVCSHTTASDALWCGVPVLTLAGKTFASRVAASLLHATQCKELVTHNIEDYKTHACMLAQCPDKLAALKARLIKDRMDFSLFDSAATTRALEAAYLQAITLHQTGKPPQSFALTPDTYHPN